MVPDAELVDPGETVEPEEILDYIVGQRQQGRRAWQHLLHVVLLIGAVLGLAALWRFTPLHDWLDIDRMAAAGRWIQESPFTPLLVLGIYLLGGIVVAPVTLLVIATVGVFGPWLGAFYALLGSELSALLTFGIGHLLGRDAVGRLAGDRARSISRALSRRGIVVIVTLRILPVAPFSVINVIAGISDIRLRDFAIGNLLGMLPGVIAIAFLTDSLVASLRDPGATSIIVLMVTVVLVILALYGLRLWAGKRRSRRSNAA